MQCFDFIEVLIKIIAWMKCSKHTKKQLRTYFEDVDEIKILNDILTSYSHAKVSRIYKYEIIHILFELFINHNKDSFLSNFKGEQRDKYKEALDEFAENFKKQQTSITIHM